MTAIPNKKRIRVEVEASQTLLEQAKDGSDEAFRQLVLLHQAPVRAFVSRFLLSSHVADDVSQEVFLTAYKQLKNFRGESRFSTWLLGIARNKAKQFLRLEIRQRRMEEKLAESRRLQRRLDRLEHESDLTTEESRIEALQVCLEQIPEPSRGLVQSYYFERQTSAVIASRTNKKESAIRMKLMRIRQALHKCIISRMKSGS